MPKPTGTAPGTAGAEAPGQSTGLHTVGDAFEAMSAGQRRSILSSFLTKPAGEINPEPAAESPPEVDGQSAVTRDLSQPAAKPEPEDEAPAEAEGEEEQPPTEESEQEQADAEGEAEGEADAEEDGDAEETEEHQPGTPEWVQKRIDKAHRKQKDAERLAQEKAQENEVLRAKLNEQLTRVDSLPNEVIQADPAMKKAQETLGQHQQALAEVEQLLEQVDTDPDAVARRLQAANIPARGSDSETLRRQLDGLRQYFREGQMEAKLEARLVGERVMARKQAESAQHFQAALKEFPWMADQKSAEFEQGLKLIEKAPWLKLIPDGYRYVGEIVEGRKALEARKAPAKPKPAASAKKRPVNIPAPRSAPAQRPARNEPEIDSNVWTGVAEGDQGSRLKVINNMLNKQAAR